MTTNYLFLKYYEHSKLLFWDIRNKDPAIFSLSNKKYKIVPNSLLHNNFKSLRISKTY